MIIQETHSRSLLASVRETAEMLTLILPGNGKAIELYYTHLSSKPFYSVPLLYTGYSWNQMCIISPENAFAYFSLNTTGL